MNESAIQEALHNAVKAAVAASDVPDLPIQFPEVQFSKPPDGKYLEIVVVRNHGDGITWGNEPQNRGILTLIYHRPIKNTGIFVNLAVVDSIASYFHKGLQMRDDANSVCVRVQTNPSIGSQIINGHESLYPVSVRYQC